MSLPHRQHPFAGFVGLCTAVLVVTALNLAEEFFVPLALAALLAFMLSPLVRGLCKWGLPRTVSVVVITAFAFSVLCLLFWVLGQQVTNLASQLPEYSGNIKKRVEAVQSLGDHSFIQKMRRFGQDLGTPSEAKSDGEAPVATAPASPAPAPTTDQVQNKSQDLVSSSVNMILAGLAGALGTGSVVVLYLIFMLLRQEDIGQRIVGLAGYNRLTTTTRALDEAGERVSHYLLMQGTVNVLYGLLLGSLLAIIGMPYAVLWGTLGAVFRYIPYIGPIVVSVLPITFSLAYFEGWGQPSIIIAVIVVLELTTNMVLEPVLYGKSTGVSDFALIVAIVFWTWLWGGIGLILATPMTVCLVVLCKYIPNLHWVEIVMGDTPKSSPPLDYYQQLISNQDEVAFDAVEESINQAGVVDTVQNMVLPALSLTRRETLRGNLTDSEQQDVHRQIELTLNLIREYKAKDDKAAADEAPADEQPDKPVVVFARALHGEADALALRLLETCLPPNVVLEISNEPHLIGELIATLEEKKPDIVCISAIAPESEMGASVLCRRFRKRLPNLKIVVCSWNLPDEQKDTRALQEAGASAVATDIQEAASIIAKLARG